ncbi:mitochondrial carrier [Malassezia pachydermatis]|uniref:Mitochondrial carrier n=1 Tax=Malassezia pachydermatis TaxID=77020 RepID=A0A0M9VQG7_9BASI|nr:mitochondrial carrier [Malassezia pachydermatis]KOS15332.1 mitochondrial carrier [Malassezia pachydermatis]
MAPEGSADLAIEPELDYEGLGGNYPLHINMIAGSLAGITEHGVMFPVDVIRTRMQVLTTSPSATYTGIADAFARISSVEGFRALWKGIASVILGAGPAHALYFGTYELVKDLTGGNKEGFQFLSTTLAGASATIVSDAFMNPFDVIKQRMQMHGSPYTSITHCATHLFRSEGLRAFYVSYPTTLAMTVPFTAIQFATYEWAQEVLNPNNHYSPMAHAVGGGFAGAIAAACTNPLDVTKTLLQTKGCSSDPEIRHAKSMWQAGRIIYAREGLRGFMRGLTPRIFSHMPSNALAWLSYEGFRSALHEYGNES